MNKALNALSLSVALFVSQTVFASPYSEVGDAGYTLGTAQLLPGTSSISGNLGGSDSVDVYRFGWAGGTFEASTSTVYENTINTGDPMLFVFDLAGNMLAFNDDWNDLESFLSFSLAAGEYLLAIDEFSYNYGGNLAGFSDAGTVPAGYYMSYTISLRDATSSIPEPTSIALLGLGLAGLGLRRRKQ